MKKLFEKVTVMVLIIAMVLTMMPVSMTNIEAAAKPKLVKKSASIVIGQTKAIKVKNKPKGAKVTYKLTNKKVATVTKKGKVTGVKSGKTKIIVTIKNGKKTIKLNYNVSVKKPKISNSNISLSVGKTVKLSIKNKPKKASYVWSSSNNNIATVDRSGNITAKSTGNATIAVSVKTKKKTYRLSCNIMVTSIPDNPEAQTYTVTFDSNGGSVVASQIVRANEKVTQPENPTKDGYVFDGWYTDVNCTNAFNFATTVINSNITLYAKWKIGTVIGEGPQYEHDEMLDTLGEDVEFYSFDADVRSIPVGETKIVTFTSEIYANISLEDIQLMTNDSIVSTMNDDGINGDVIANDGIYTAQVTLSNDQEDYVEYYILAGTSQSEKLGIGYYELLTTDELTAMEMVDNRVSELLSSNEYTSCSEEERKQLMESLLNTLYLEGLIAVVNPYDEEEKFFSFQYMSGVYGGISLKKLDDDVNGSLSNNFETASYEQKSDGNFPYDTTAFSSKNGCDVLILNGFENVPDRRDYYNSLERTWDSQALNTTIDVDVTVSDLKKLDNYDVIVFAMHGNKYQQDGRGKKLPVLCINETVTSDKDAAYSYELNTRHSVIKVQYEDRSEGYFVMPRFFEDNYSVHSFTGRMVFSESCMFYGCDCQNTAPDRTMAQAITGRLADVVVGYHNSVEKNYSRNVMKLTIEETYAGKTIEKALSTSKNKYGSDDNWEDATEHKYNAYPIIEGNKQFILNRQGTGTITGIVQDSMNNIGIKNALIRVYDRGSTIARGRTDDSGTYTIGGLDEGTYIIEISASKYQRARIQVIVQNGVTTYNEIFLLVRAGISIGHASGRILNAATAEGISDVTIRVRLGWNNRYGAVLKTVKTSSNGAYKISDLLTGWYTIECVKDGYITGWNNIVLCIIDGNSQDFSISPELTGDGEFRIVLQWRNRPDDLDSHLTGPIAGSSERFHLYYPYATANDGFQYDEYVELDWDNTDINERLEPETITIHQQLDGVYRYSIHDYTNGDDASSIDLANSNATVTVYKGNAVIATYAVPTGIPGTIWTVFELNGNAIIPINTIKTGVENDPTLYNIGDIFNTENIETDDIDLIFSSNIKKR